MKIAVLLASLIFSFDKVHAYCVDVKNYQGAFKVVEVVTSSMSCQGKPKERLKLSGCDVKLSSVENKEEVMAFGIGEICNFKKDHISNLEIRGVCCDTQESFGCALHKGGVFNLERSYEALSCLSGLERYIVSYTVFENGKTVKKMYDSNAKGFVVSAPEKKTKKHKK